ncbi:hypothetical protein BZA05DRAFT_447122 [Tricharina praecox]|uniref:uncharacterized protein n=1 Tax=Tricharina praecox TaxID=43433 RepID=UPI0022205EEA|nr:uncharacterized protein BZA05DRAFT_447122 [Tricharina praecox]KAI5846838.1 hypothetical protein BZA05DRAFT_447122 [Tricharina praecox]
MAAAKPKGIIERAPKKPAPKKPAPKKPADKKYTYHLPANDSVIHALKECPEPSGKFERYAFRNEVFRRVSGPGWETYVGEERVRGIVALHVYN